MTPAERETLEKLQRSQAAPHQQALRAKALLLAADGEANTRIAEEVGGDTGDGAGLAAAVRRRRARRVDKIREDRGRKPSMPEATIAEIVRLTTTTTPQGSTHW